MAGERRSERGVGEKRSGESEEGEEGSSKRVKFG